MEYFARRRSRVWKGPAKWGWDKWRNLTVNKAGGALGAVILLDMHGDSPVSTYHVLFHEP
jgi:hypothetical protein